MYQLKKMPFTWFLLYILKQNFTTYDLFWADGSHTRMMLIDVIGKVSAKISGSTISICIADGMVPVVTAAEDGTPTSSSPPSPNTEQLHEERRLIRPIGTERSTKKQRILTSQGPGYNFILNSMAPIPQWSTCQIASGQFESTLLHVIC